MLSKGEAANLVQMLHSWRCKLDKAAAVSLDRSLCMHKDQFTQQVTDNTRCLSVQSRHNDLTQLLLL